MKKFKRIIAGLAIALCAVLSLASCKNKTLKEWQDAGCNIDKDTVNKFVSVEDIQSMVSEQKEGDNDIVCFLASSEAGTARIFLEEFDLLADELSYEGAIYIVTITEALSSVTKMKATREALGVKELEDPNGIGLVCVCYRAGELYFDTSAYDKADNSPIDRFYFGNTINFIALATYAMKYCPVEK